MKNIFLILLLCFFSFSLFAQYDKVGKTYNFTSDGVNLELSYLENGVAKIKKTSVEDKTTRWHIYGDMSHFYDMTVGNTDNSASIENKHPEAGKKYWIIPFSMDKIEAKQPGRYANVVVSCKCTSGVRGTCSLSGIVGKNTANFTCVPEESCSSCLLNTSTVSGQSFGYSFLLVEANSVILE